MSAEDPIKISRLKIRNLSTRSRRLSVTAYVEWVLGASRAAAAPYVVTEIDSTTEAMLARNPWRSDFGGRVAFADLAGKQTAWTGDRTKKAKRRLRHLVCGAKRHVYRVIYEIDEPLKLVRVLTIRHGAMDDFIRGR